VIGPNGAAAPEPRGQNLGVIGPNGAAAPEQRGQNLGVIGPNGAAAPEQRGQNLGVIGPNGAAAPEPRGQILGVIGPNGAGKSTLLNVIAGVHKPTSGAVRLDGRVISGLNPDRICRLGVARTFQIPHPFNRMTALENVLVAATFGRRRQDGDAQQAAEEMLEFTGFPVSPHTPASSLNTAQLRRLDLARALVSRPGLLLLDESAAGLTPNELAELQQLIFKIRDQGVCILIVEHLMRLIMELCDRIVVLQYGVKIAEGSPQEICEDETVTQAYLGEKYLLA
jgi:branched-chain amino acid transport system ATP-binding protein